MTAKLSLVFAALLWGLWGIGEKLAVARVHPYTVQWMYSVPYILLLPLWFMLARRAAPQQEAMDWTAFAWASGACVASLVAMLLMIFAMRTEPASVSVAITSAYPVVTLLLGVLMGEETINAKRLIGLGLTISGVIVLQLPER
jgi:drug/metabolite transporter (DMT)-like permease